ncbi:MAG: glycosyltransferase family 4 protein [Aquihabitans sp.]
MTQPRRIAVLKPDFGVAGGFERVVDRIERSMRRDGHDVTRLTVDMMPPRREVAGLTVPDDVWDAAPEYFRYLAGRDAFDRLDTRRYDAVVSTQPPSFSHGHPRHLAIFFHHHRVYYDLEERYLQAGFSPDPAVHRRAGELIRQLDQPRLDAVTHFLAGSTVVASRLAHFNGRHDAGIYHAGIGIGSESDPFPTDPGRGAVLCVGRHEFPKRTELVVAAAHLLPHLRFDLVGTGGREAWARGLDHRLSLGADPAALTETELWCNTGQAAAPAPDDFTSNVTFAGRLGDDDLARRYRDAPCVVAPAYDEDYGLTAIEAMAQGRPVVVCADGGGLAELVDHDVTGLVVEPTPVAIASAIEALVTDPVRASELGANGRARAAQLSWKSADEELRAGLERVLA